MKCLECGEETELFGWRDRQPAVAQYGHEMTDDDPNRFEMMWRHFANGEYIGTCVKYSPNGDAVPPEMEGHIVTVTPCNGNHADSSGE